MLTIKVKFVGIAKSELNLLCLGVKLAAIVDGKEETQCWWWVLHTTGCFTPLGASDYAAQHCMLLIMQHTPVCFRLCCRSLGYPIAFMAHMHNMTGKPEYLQTAETILEFVGRCHPNSRNSIIAHKVPSQTRSNAVRDLPFAHR